MRLTTSIPVRLEPELRERVLSLSENTGLSSSDIIRRAVMEYVTEAERSGHIYVRVDNCKHLRQVAEKPQAGAVYRTRSPK